MVVRIVRRQIAALEVLLFHIAVPVTSRSLHCPRGAAPRMRGFPHWPAFALAVLSIGACLSFSSRTAQAQTAADQRAAQPAAELAQWQQGLATWRAQHEKDIASPEGWLSLAGLEWLKTGINSVGSSSDNQIRLQGQAPEHLGMLTISGKAPGDEIVQLLAPAGGFPAGMTMDGKPAREGSLVVNDARPSTIAWHGLSFVVLKRGDRYVLRVKDAESPARAGFHGLNWYAPDPNYRVAARWVPFKPPQVEEIPTVIGTTLKLPAPGLAMFLLDGKVMHLEPVLEDPAGKTLFFILRDDTSKTTTYGGGRFLHTPLPDHGLDQPGSLILDFNQLENPPCAYTIYATCPLPPEQNRLDISLEAGEQRYQR
jgi:hypothetical protein